MNINIEFSDSEIDKLEKMAKVKGMTVKSLVKHFVRVSHDIEIRIQNGDVSVDQLNNLITKNTNGCCLAHENEEGDK
jgi:hypothetical protein